MAHIVRHRPNAVMTENKLCNQLNGTEPFYPGENDPPISEYIISAFAFMLLLACIEKYMLVVPMLIIGIGLIVSGVKAFHIFEEEKVNYVKFSHLKFFVPLLVITLVAILFTIKPTKFLVAALGVYIYSVYMFLHSTIFISLKIDIDKEQDRVEYTLYANKPDGLISRKSTIESLPSGRYYLPRPVPPYQTSSGRKS